MALLTLKEREQAFSDLSLGEYSEAGIKAFQKAYMRSQDADGIYGANTDNALRTAWYVKLYTKNFKPEEFKCGCNGRYCCGYPDYMKPVELKHMQTIRDHFGQPITVTCGLRCRKYNDSLAGSIKNSLHLTGFAVDFYQQGVTDTTSHRKAAIKYIKTLPGHHYTYGDGFNSVGYAVRASYMGNALHTDTQGDISDYVIPETVDDSKLTVDGIGGASTVSTLQRFLGTTADGVISGQTKSLSSYYPALTAVSYGKGGSDCVKALQKWCGITADGIWGEKTSKAVQKKLGVSADGIFGKNSMKALQKYLNSKLYSDTDTAQADTASDSDLVIDVSEFQSEIDWAKVKATGINGAIIRCGYRGYEKGTLNRDSMFLSHIKGAYSAGLRVGVYFFTEGITAAEGKEEADYTLSLIKKADIPLSYPVAIDTEAQSPKNERAKNLSKATRTEVIKAFCEEIKSSGYEPMIYASTSWLNNKLDMSKLPYKVWCAQYYSKCQYDGNVVIWQYTSSGSVAGISGKVDMNHCYLADGYMPKTGPDISEKSGYAGTLPTLDLKKTNAEVIADTITWAKWIAGDNSFHYGHGENAHHNGCYFCGTNTLKGGRAKTGVKNYEKSYCCNPFVHAAFAHGGCVPTMLKICRSGGSYDFGTTAAKSYEKSSLFDNLGKIAKSKLKKGDVLCNDKHVALYIGSGKMAEASGGDDNKPGSATWNKSIHICDLTDSRYEGFKRVYRFNGSVDTTANICHGEVGNRVKDLQAALKYLGYDISSDGIFGDTTLKVMKAFQTKCGLSADGIFGAKSLAKLKEVLI